MNRRWMGAVTFEQRGRMHDAEHRMRAWLHADRIRRTLQLLPPKTRAVFLQPIEVFESVKDDIATRGCRSVEDEAAWLHDVERWLLWVERHLADARLKVMFQELGFFSEHDD